MGGHATGALDELIGNAAQSLHLICAQNIGHNDGADFIVLLDLGPAQHCILPSPVA
jgi:hypothetical protein